MNKLLWKMFCINNKVCLHGMWLLTAKRKERFAVLSHISSQAAYLTWAVIEINFSSLVIFAWSGSNMHSLKSHICTYSDCYLMSFVKEADLL